ncbi:MAG: glycoside hydrolase family 88 protein [Nanoarchaeota archaeon]|nr:glycoside hydrolase family 88 protein [Nanoarchaeota archaeon]
MFKKIFKDSFPLSNNMEENIKIAKNWLLNSGIQNIKGEHKGAFNSWFDINKKNYPYAYSEITGYGITLLIFLYNLIKEEILLERANLATDWLINKAKHNSGGILTRHFYDKANFMGSFENEEIFAFDCGMVLNGVTNLYNITKDEKHLEFCINLADFMINKMQKQNGSFYAIYNAKNNTLKDDGEKWSTQSGAFHAKLSIGLINLYIITKNTKYKESAKKICDYSLKFLKDNGRFITFNKTGDTLFHPHCYVSEGFYMAGNYLKNNNYLESSKKSINYLFENQLESGGIPQMFKNNQFINFERTDILAQTLRMGVLFSKDKDKLNNLTKRLLEFQVKEGDQKGGFIYGYDDSGKKYEHVNSWCTMFALQALILYQRYLENNINFNSGLIV